MEAIWGHLAGEEGAAALAERAIGAGQRVEALFYAGAHRLVRGDEEGAARLLARAVEEPEPRYVEHVSARAILERLEAGPRR